MFKKKKSGSILYKPEILIKVRGDIYTRTRNLWFPSANRNNLQRIGIETNN